MLIDSHCHLNYASLGEDVPGVLARARSAGVGGFLLWNPRGVYTTEALRPAEQPFPR